jgi:hypothetical protein
VWVAVKDNIAHTLRIFSAALSNYERKSLTHEIQIQFFGCHDVRCACRHSGQLAVNVWLVPFCR